MLTERLTALFDYIANSRDVDWADVTSLAAEISKDILKQSQTIDRSMQAEFADILKLMKAFFCGFQSVNNSEKTVI